MKLEISFLYLKKFTMRKKKSTPKNNEKKNYSNWVTWVTAYMCVCWVSQVAQWKRICLPVQETQET